MVATGPSTAPLCSNCDRPIFFSNHDIDCLRLPDATIQSLSSTHTLAPALTANINTMAIEAFPAKCKVASFGFEHFPAPVDVFSSEDEEPAPNKTSDASSDNVIEHELVYPPKPFPGEDLNHDWLAMMLNEQHDVHMRASARLKTARKDVDAAAAELMKLKHELAEERDAFGKMLERLEKIIGAEELASVVELMQRGMQYGTFDFAEHVSDAEGGHDAEVEEEAGGEDEGASSPDHEEDGRVGKNGAVVIGGYDAEDEQDSDDEALLRSNDDIENIERTEEWKRRAEYDENLPDQYAAEDIWYFQNKEHEAATCKNNVESCEDSEANAGHVSEPSNPAERSASIVTGASYSMFLPNPESVLHQEKTNLHDSSAFPASESRDNTGSGRASSSSKIATGDVHEDVSPHNHGSPASDGQEGTVDEVVQSKEKREASPDALSYTSKSDYGEQREEVAPLLSPIHLSNPETDVLSQHPSPRSLSSSSKSSAALARSVLASSSSTSSPAVRCVEQFVVTVDVTKTTAQTEAAVSPPPADHPATPPAGPLKTISPKSIESVKFISANFDISQHRGPITTRKRRRLSTAFEPEAGPSKRARNDKVNGALPASPNKDSKSTAASDPTPATGAVAPAVSQDPPAVASMSIFGPILSAFESSKRALSFNSRSSAKK